MTGILAGCNLNPFKHLGFIQLNAAAIIIGTLMQSSKSRIPADPAPQQPATKHEGLEEKVGRFSGLVGGVHGAGHFALFASLCFLVYLPRALEEQHRSYYYKMAFDILLFAAVTESLQHLTLDRSPGTGDWLMDLGGMLAAFFCHLIVRAGMRVRAGKAAN